MLSACLLWRGLGGNAGYGIDAGVVAWQGTNHCQYFGTVLSLMCLWHIV
jgi:hypothetical protein